MWKNSKVTRYKLLANIQPKNLEENVCNHKKCLCQYEKYISCGHRDYKDTRKKGLFGIFLDYFMYLFIQ